MTNYMIKNYNQAAELMCDYIAVELKLDEVTKEVLKARIYSDYWIHFRKIVKEKLGHDETVDTKIDLADMLLCKLGLVINDKLVLPTYDNLENMKKMLEK